MTGYLIGGGILVVIAAAIYFHRSGIRQGASGVTAKTLDKGLKGVGDARKAVDDVRRDAVARERLRDKYRS